MARVVGGVTRVADVDSVDGAEALVVVVEEEVEDGAGAEGTSTES